MALFKSISLSKIDPTKVKDNTAQFVENAGRAFGGSILKEATEKNQRNMQKRNLAMQQAIAQMKEAGMNSRHAAGLANQMSMAQLREAGANSRFNKGISSREKMQQAGFGQQEKIAGINNGYAKDMAIFNRDSNYGLQELRNSGSLATQNARNSAYKEQRDETKADELSTLAAQKEAQSNIFNASNELTILQAEAEAAKTRGDNESLAAIKARMSALPTEVAQWDPRAANVFNNQISNYNAKGVKYNQDISKEALKQETLTMGDALSKNRKLKDERIAFADEALIRATKEGVANPVKYVSDALAVRDQVSVLGVAPDPQYNKTLAAKTKEVNELKKKMKSYRSDSNVKKTTPLKKAPKDQPYGDVEETLRRYKESKNKSTTLKSASDYSIGLW